MGKTQKYEREFKQFDKNGDGEISAWELKLWLAAVGKELTEEEAEAAVELMDVDGDGKLGLEDVASLMEEEEDDQAEEDLMREAFKMYEMDGSGMITDKSLMRMLCRLGQFATIDTCKLMIARFDINGDGVLNFDEFRIMMMS